MPKERGSLLCQRGLPRTWEVSITCLTPLKLLEVLESGTLYTGNSGVNAAKEAGRMLGGHMTGS